MQIVPIDRVEAKKVEALLDRAFGTDRHGRTAYRLRAGTTAVPDLSFAMLDGHALIGTIQCWPVLLTGDDGETVPMTLVGPVAVEPERQQAGVGRALMERMLAADGSAIVGGNVLMMIGDPEYYGRFFGFNADATGKWRLPGPFEPRRLLARGVRVPASAGIVGPRPLNLEVAIMQFASNVLQTKGHLPPLPLGAVSDANAELVRRMTGFDLAGFHRLIESSDVRHTFASHGNATREAKRGQKPIRKLDLAKISIIVEVAHRVEIKGEPRSAKGQRLAYYATVGEEQFEYVEAIRPNGKLVALKTMLKR